MTDLGQFIDWTVIGKYSTLAVQISDPKLSGRPKLISVVSVLSTGEMSMLSSLDKMLTNDVGSCDYPRNVALGQHCYPQGNTSGIEINRFQLEFTANKYTCHMYHCLSHWFDCGNSTTRYLATCTFTCILPQGNIWVRGYSLLP